MEDTASLSLEPFRFEAYGHQLEHELMHAPREKIRAHQFQRLRHLLDYAYHHIPFYRRHWDEGGFHPRDFQSMDDMVRIPTWSVQEQRVSIERNPPFGDFSVQGDPADLAIMLSTSGTTGTPRLARIYQQDLPGLKEIMGRAYRWVGIGPGDIVQVTFTYAPLGAAWCCTWAAQAVGAAILPASSGRTTSSERQVDLMRQAGVTALIGTASYLIRLGEVARSKGLDPASFSVRKIITAGELASPMRRAELEKMWNARVYDLFGSVDTLTWSSLDCEASRAEHGRLGMHIWEDACLIEVLGENRQPVAPGEYGEMCVTSWVWRSAPKIRFRTGDLTAVSMDPCGCGRTTARMMPIAGRTDHVLRIRATHIYPMALETAIQQACQGTVEWLVEAWTRPGAGDRLILRIEQEAPGDERRRASIETAVRQQLAFNSVDVELVAPGMTMDATGAGRDPKVRRIFDRRTHS